MNDRPLLLTELSELGLGSNHTLTHCGQSVSQSSNWDSFVRRCSEDPRFPAHVSIRPNEWLINNIKTLQVVVSGFLGSAKCRLLPLGHWLTKWLPLPYLSTGVCIPVVLGIRGRDGEKVDVWLTAKYSFAILFIFDSYIALIRCKSPRDMW